MVKSEELTEAETFVPPFSSTTITQKHSKQNDIGKQIKVTRQKSAAQVRIQHHLRSRSSMLKTATSNGGEIAMHSRPSSLPR